MGEEERKELNMESKKAEGERESPMTPWEQHAKVISIPRFDYKAPSSLLQRSHSAFLITCSIKREKSATKEAMSIFSKYVWKRRKMFQYSDKSEGPEFVLSLVKLTRSGLLLLTIPVENSLDTIDVVSKIFCDLESGSLKSPLWCHRIFPIQATCTLNEKELHAVVSKLVQQYVNDKGNELPSPLKFAVGFNRRGTEESQVKISKDASKNSDLSVLLDRNKCFSVVAAAVKGIVSDSVVDLKSPELSVLVELLPLSGVPNSSVVVGVSALPLKLVSTKPKLCIKPLVGDKNGKKAI